MGASASTDALIAFKCCVAKLAQLPYPGDVRVVRETNNGG